MLKIGIVGTSHLTDQEKIDAEITILHIIREKEKYLKTNPFLPLEIITGDAEGIDSLVKEICNRHAISVKIAHAHTKKWEGINGFKARNMAIAQQAEFIYSISTLIKKTRCYHCDTPDHERTGGCWTLRYAKDKLHKLGRVIIV